jgi:hypothetical protein
MAVTAVVTLVPAVLGAEGRDTSSIGTGVISISDTVQKTCDGRIADRKFRFPNLLINSRAMPSVAPRKVPTSSVLIHATASLSAVLSRHLCVTIVNPCDQEQEVLPLLFERLRAAAGDWPFRTRSCWLTVDPMTGQGALRGSLAIRHDQIRERSPRSANSLLALRKLPMQILTTCACKCYGDRKPPGPLHTVLDARSEWRLAYHPFC